MSNCSQSYISDVNDLSVKKVEFLMSTRNICSQDPIFDSKKKQKFSSFFMFSNSFLTKKTKNKYQCQTNTFITSLRTLTASKVVLLKVFDKLLSKITCYV